MLFSADGGLVLVAIAGHIALWVAIVNRLHCTALPQSIVLALTLATAGACAAPLAWGAWLLWRHGYPADGAIGPNLAAWHWLYLAVCWAAAAAILPARLHDRLLARPPAALQSNHGERASPSFDAPPSPSPGALARLVLAIPGNQAYSLERTEKTLLLPRLHPALDGLVVAHLSDLHISGRIRKEYFQHAVQLVNDMRPDLIALTGDLVEKDRCLQWIADTFGRLHAPLGVFFVLGNHDRKVDVRELVSALTEAGLTHVGGRWLAVETRGKEVLLAGNELPWLMPSADPSRAPADPQGRVGLRLALSHSPDQIGWARSQGFDLMLAGHTHGGQVRLPKLGPVLAPSRYGVKYASGTFHEPPTLLHVSRGLSSELPLRMFCLPEITRLVLRSSQGA